MGNLFSFDAVYFQKNEWVVGVDEVGRGPLAGPVTASAFAINRDWFIVNKRKDLLQKVNDSKKLKESDRESLYEFAFLELEKNSEDFFWKVAHASVEEIDELNILEATKLAMQRALDALESSLAKQGGIFEKVARSGMFEFETVHSPVANVCLLVDGKPLKDFPYIHQPIVKGDGKSFSIAMASILAKVTRDRMMFECSKEHPEYRWDKNKGYGTKVHREALEKYGATSFHRRSFLTKLVVKGE